MNVLPVDPRKDLVEQILASTDRAELYDEVKAIGTSTGSRRSARHNLLPRQTSRALKP